MENPRKQLTASPDSHSMNEIYKFWKNGQVADSYMAMVYFINRFSIDHNDQKLSKRIGQEPYSEILKSFQFKKIKGKAINCLKKWVRGEWTLVLSEKIFTPYEVLSYQAQGIRPVTMKFDITNTPIMHRKNSLDFFVHDLEHGHMFFSDIKLMKMQKDFFFRLEKSLSTDLWKVRLQEKKFREKFYYMISDMNSHLEHYKAYLYSMIPREDYPSFEFLFEE